MSSDFITLKIYKVKNICISIHVLTHLLLILKFLLMRISKTIQPGSKVLFLP